MCVCVCVHIKLYILLPLRGNPQIHGGGGLVTKSCPTLMTPWTIACQTPLSMGFSRQEYWNELPFPSPGDLPNPGIKPRSPALQADSLPTEIRGKPKTLQIHHIVCVWVSCSVMSNSAAPQPVANKAPLSMGFSRQE